MVDFCFASFCTFACLSDISFSPCHFSPGCNITEEGFHSACGAGKVSQYHVVRNSWHLHALWTTSRRELTSQGCSQNGDTNNLPSFAEIRRVLPRKRLQPMPSSRSPYWSFRRRNRFCIGSSSSRTAASQPTSCCPSLHGRTVVQLWRRTSASGD